MFFLSLFVLSDLISIPFSCYNTFVIEEKYGFNKMTVKTFIFDKIKSYLLTIILGGALLYGALLIVNFLENGFWFSLWLSLSILMLLINIWFIDLPIFNKLKPLESGSLREKIEQYSQKVGYSLKNIYVIDGSKDLQRPMLFLAVLAQKNNCFIRYINCESY